MPVFAHFRTFVKFFQYRGQYGEWFTKFQITPKTYSLNLNPTALAMALGRPLRTRMAEALANKLKARYMEGEERKLNAAHAAYALRFSAASLRGSAGRGPAGACG